MSKSSDDRWWLGHAQKKRNAQSHPFNMPD